MISMQRIFLINEKDRNLKHPIVAIGPEKAAEVCSIVYYGGSPCYIKYINKEAND